MMQSEPLIELSGPTDASESPLTGTRIDGAGQLSAFDLATLRAARVQDHGFWLAQPSQTLLAFADSTGAVGYAYAGAAGIGPAVGRYETTLAAVLDAALGWLHARGQTGASLKLPGSACVSLAVLLERGFRYEPYPADRQFRAHAQSRPLRGVGCRCAVLDKVGRHSLFIWESMTQSLTTIYRFAEKPPAAARALRRRPRRPPHRLGDPPFAMPQEAEPRLPAWRKRVRHSHPFVRT
jgi:hypothetical protein